VLDRAQATRRDAQGDRRTQDVRHHGRVLNIGQEAAAGLVIGVADIVARQDALTGDFAATGHWNLDTSNRNCRD
jgi:hypothetical protein